MNISLKVIPHNEHRYETCGDYWSDAPGCWQVRVSRMQDWRYEMLVGIHEIVELVLVIHSGIKQEDIDNFDIAFEANRKPDDEGEPGDDPKAPYVIQHCIATGVERIVAAFLGVSWKKYEEALNSI